MDKILKITTILSLCFLLNSNTILGQNNEHKNLAFKSPEVLLEKIDSKLNLNPTQEKRVFTLLKNNFKAKQEIINDRKKIKKVKKEELTSILSSILTQDQMDKFRLLQENRKLNKNNQKTCKLHKEKHNCKNKLDKLTNELNLSEEQISRIKVIFENNKIEREIRRVAFKKKKENSHSKFMKGMKAILTSSQYKTFEEIIQQREKNKHN